MFNLVRNELTKIFRKKGIYIVLVIFLILSSLMVGLQKYGESMTWETMHDGTIQYLQDELSKIDTSTKEGKEQYLRIQAELELYQLAIQYGGYATWQGRMIFEDIWPIKMDMVTYENNLENSAQHSMYNKEELQQQYNKIMGRIEKGDWRSFVEEDLKETKEQIEAIQKTLESTNDAKTIRELNKNIEILKIQEQVNKWRLEKDIAYEDEKYDNTLERYSSCGNRLIESNYQHNINETNYMEKETEEFGYSSKIEYQNNLEEFKISKYRIENEKPNLANKSSAYILENFITEIGLLFIIIISIMITATIVSDEFNKGTIKLLLIRPYTRRKIMLSKIIASIIAIIAAIICIILIQTIIAGIFYGFDTMNVPVIQYNFNTNNIIEINVFVWLIINLLCVSPIIIILSAIALMVGTIFANAASAISIGILTDMGATILQTIAIYYGAQIKWLRFIPFVNWDLTQVLNGRLSQIEGATLPIAITSCLIILIVITIITFENFARKNIKNV